MQILADYANELKNAVTELTNAKQAVQEIRKAMNEAEGKNDPESIEKWAQAKKRLPLAEEDLKRAQNACDVIENRKRNKREEIRAAYEADSALDPAEMDANSLTLLQSGLMSVEDYERMYAGANPTMRRLVAQFAGKAAEAETDTGRRRRLDVIAQNSAENRIREAMGAIEGIEDLFRRCAANPVMLDYWDTFCNVDTLKRH